MEGELHLFWEIGHMLSNVLWKKCECLESPKIETKDGTSWWLDFYPAGDDDDTDGLVFWLNRDNADKTVKATFQIQFCFYKVPVRQYTLQHDFEKNEDCHKWIIDDVKNLTQLKIFIPISSLCILGFLTVRDTKNSSESDSSGEMPKSLCAINV